MRKEFKSQRIFWVHLRGRHFIVLEHQYGRRDVMWKRSILFSLCVIRVLQWWKVCPQKYWVELPWDTQPLSIIHYLLLLLIIIFIITIIIIIDELYFPRLVNCFLLFYYLIYRARTFEFVTLQHQCICRMLKLPVLHYIITNLPIWI